MTHRASAADSDSILGKRKVCLMRSRECFDIATSEYAIRDEKFRATRGVVSPPVYGTIGRIRAEGCSASW